MTWKNCECNTEGFTLVQLVIGFFLSVYVFVSGLLCINVVALKGDWQSCQITHKWELAFYPVIKGMCWLDEEIGE